MRDGRCYSANMRNRLAVTAAVGMMATLAMLTLSPSGVVAQTSETQTPQGTASLPLPSIGLPLPSIGLPHPAMGLPPVETRKTEPSPVPRERAGNGRTNDGQANVGGTRDGGRRGRQGRPVVVYPPLVYVPPTTAPAATGTSVGAPKPTVAAESPAMGRLVVDVTPAAAAQLYVDGYYVGTPADYPEGIEMTAGPHTFEVRVPGAEPVSTSLQIAAGRAITYRAALDAAERKTPAKGAAVPTTPPAAATPVAADPVSRTPFYLIPGCYLGNIPPNRDNVPAGCDISQVKTIKP